MKASLYQRRLRALHVRPMIEENRSTDSIYTAHPLHVTGSASIQLLELSSYTIQGEEHHTIKMVIEIVLLNQAPPYVALSRVWGSPEPARTMNFAGQSFNVRINLPDFPVEAQHR